MEQEEKNPTTQTQNSESGQGGAQEASEYLKAIEQLKKTTVSKEAYDRLREENKTLIKGILDGTAVPTANTEEQKSAIDVAKIRKELFSFDNHMSNLEYVEKALELRKGIMEQGGQDPFLPSGSKVVPSQEDIEAANRVASVFQECVDYAQGDSDIFTNELMRRTVDVGPTVKKGR